jgi:hypothetical protein
MIHPVHVSLAGLLLVASTGLATPATGPEAPRNEPTFNAQPNGLPDRFTPDHSPRDSRTECDTAIQLACNSTFSGSSALSQNGDFWQAYCFSGESAPEVIHRLDHPGGLLTLTLNSSDSAQLDLILLGDCDPFNCLAMPWLVGSSESISGTYAAGTYYVVVDAFNWNGLPFTYELGTVCVGNVDLCANALPLPCGQVTSGSSADSQNGNAWGSYCFSGESAPEVVYELNHPGGPLNLHLTSSTSSQLDLILLGSCDAEDCLAMPWFVGSDETISGDYPAGTYYVVVDAFAWNGLPFDFEIDVTCPGEQDFCTGAIPLGCNETVTGGSALSQNGNLWGQYCFGARAPRRSYTS